MLLLTSATAFMDFMETDVRKVQCYYASFFKGNGGLLACSSQ